ncbi:MAG TPA: transcriptional repressor AgaR [Chitinophagaceae bacterium]|jgi:DeoR family transcriptional regulator of aga operon|nr:transcriptional repressor AgaR [Chitinophagaceae bacterium]
MARTTKRSTVGRRKDILQQINDKGEVLINQLSKEFKVSEVTIRNDLEQLEQKRMLIRARGGAIKMQGTVSFDQRISDKDKLNYQEKAAIGKKAAELVNEGETMIIDSGTTTAEIVRNFAGFNKLTVITNALNIVNLLTELPKINVIIPGGYLRSTSMSLIGPLAEKNLHNFYVDKAFLGVDGFDTHHGIYTPNFDEAHLNEIMIEISKEVILVADSSKFKRRSLAFICPIDVIDTVVTDAGISPDDHKRLEDAGIKVIIA